MQGECLVICGVDAHLENLEEVLGANSLSPEHPVGLSAKRDWQVGEAVVGGDHPRDWTDDLLQELDLEWLDVIMKVQADCKR